MSREPITVSLSEPVNAYGEMVSQLTFNSPKGSDILKCGYPWSTETNPLTRARVETINMAAMRGLASQMAQVPESTFDALDAVDVYQVVEVVKFFFHFQTQKTSSKSPSPPDDGQETKGSSGI